MALLASVREGEERTKELVVERGSESPPLIPNHELTNSKYFIWCRLGVRRTFFLSLSCTEVVPRDPVENYLSRIAVDTASIQVTSLSGFAQFERLGLQRTSNDGFSGCSEDLANKKKIGQQRAEMAGGIQVVD